MKKPLARKGKKVKSIWVSLGIDLECPTCQQPIHLTSRLEDCKEDKACRSK